MHHWISVIRSVHFILKTYIHVGDKYLRVHNCKLWFQKMRFFQKEKKNSLGTELWKSELSLHLLYKHLIWAWVRVLLFYFWFSFLLMFLGMWQNMAQVGTWINFLASDFSMAQSYPLLPLDSKLSEVRSLEHSPLLITLFLRKNTNAHIYIVQLSAFIYMTIKTFL